MTDNKNYLVRAVEIEKQAGTFSHPFNPKSEITGTHMSRLAGLKRVGVSKVLVPPGKESFVYHSHELEEEWIYILEGRGLARIDGQEHEVAADEDLVYLMGGEAGSHVEVADFPDIGKRMVRRGSEVEIYDTADAKPFAVKIDT